MAISFDESNDYYAIADASELTLQDGDWCIGIWTRVTDNTGSFYQYLLSTNNLDVNNSLNLYLREASAATPNAWSIYIKDGDGTIVNFNSSSAPGADSTWRLIIIQRRTADSEVQMWFCEKDGSASDEGSAADTGLGAINGVGWNIGKRVGDSTDRWYGSEAAELFKGDFSLTQAQIEALGAGMPIKTLAKQLGGTLDVYLPMWEATATLLDYSNNGNDGTRYDAPATTTHPPVCTPVKRRRAA